MWLMGWIFTFVRGWMALNFVHMPYYSSLNSVFANIFQLMPCFWEFHFLFFSSSSIKASFLLFHMLFCLVLDIEFCMLQSLCPWPWPLHKMMIYILSDWNDSEWHRLKLSDTDAAPDLLYLLYNASNLHFEEANKDIGIPTSLCVTSVEPQLVAMSLNRRCVFYHVFRPQIGSKLWMQILKTYYFSHSVFLTCHLLTLPQHVLSSFLPIYFLCRNVNTSLQ